MFSGAVADDSIFICLNFLFVVISLLFATSSECYWAGCCCCGMGLETIWKDCGLC